MPPHHHPKTPPQPYSSVPPYPIFHSPYFTSTPIYASYGVPHDSHIPYLGYLHCPPPRILSSSMSPNLLPPEVRPHS